MPGPVRPGTDGTSPQHGPRPHGPRPTPTDGPGWGGRLERGRGTGGPGEPHPAGAEPRAVRKRQSRAQGRPDTTPPAAGTGGPGWAAAGCGAGHQWGQRPRSWGPVAGPYRHAPWKLLQGKKSSYKTALNKRLEHISLNSASFRALLGARQLFPVPAFEGRFFRQRSELGRSRAAGAGSPRAWSCSPLSSRAAAGQGLPATTPCPPL